MKIAVLHSRVPPEAPPDEMDTLVQVESVSQALGELGYEPVAVPFSLDVGKAVQAMERICPDLVFNLVESVEGKGKLTHLAPAVLEHLRIPYTGNSADAMFATSCKTLAKKMMRAWNLPTAEWICLNGSGNFSGEMGEGVPVILKSVWEHASVGLDEDSVISYPGFEDLRQRLQVLTRQHAGEFFAERYIEGREFNISVVSGKEGPEMFPLAEMCYLHFEEKEYRILGYRAKWKEDTFESRNTVRSFSFSPQDRPLLERLGALSLGCWHAFGLNGYVRVDFRIDSAGNPFVLEINANPGIAPDSGFVAAAKEAGLSYEAMIQRIVRHPVQIGGR